MTHTIILEPSLIYKSQNPSSSGEPVENSLTELVKSTNDLANSVQKLHSRVARFAECMTGNPAPLEDRVANAVKVASVSDLSHEEGLGVLGAHLTLAKYYLAVGLKVAASQVLEQIIQRSQKNSQERQEAEWYLSRLEPEPSPDLAIPNSVPLYEKVFHTAIKQVESCAYSFAKGNFTQIPSNHFRYDDAQEFLRILERKDSDPLETRVKLLGLAQKYSSQMKS